MRLLILPDPHLGHLRMMQLACARPENYQQQILKALANTPEKDIIICLGDVAISDETSWHKKFLSASKARKWLILGNHDKKSITWYLEQGWDCVAHSLTIKRYGHTITLSHTPIPLTNDPSLKNIHGHFHNNPPERWENHLKKLITPNHIHCCLETMNYQPLPLKTIIHQPSMKTLNIIKNPPENYKPKKSPSYICADHLQKWIPIEKCKDQYLYYIAARNAPLGIFNKKEKAFWISRHKFTNNFLFPEYHWDTGEPHGTAKPIREIEKAPRPCKKETQLSPEGKENLSYLNKKTQDLITPHDTY